MCACEHEHTNIINNHTKVMGCSIGEPNSPRYLLVFIVTQYNHSNQNITASKQRTEGLLEELAEDSA